MQVIHVHTEGVSAEYDAAFVKMVVSMVRGVRDVASLPSVGLVSVLYDEGRAEPTDIIEAVRSAGFGARQCVPAEALATATAHG